MMIEPIDHRLPADEVVRRRAAGTYAPLAELDAVRSSSAWLR